MKETIETAYALMQKHAKRFADSLDASDFVQKISEDAYMAGELFIASKIFNAKPSMKEIDWEQRRYEIAKDALIGCLAMPIIPNTDPYRRPDEMAELAIIYADALIEELKKISK